QNSGQRARGIRWFGDVGVPVLTAGQDHTFGDDARIVFSDILRLRIVGAERGEETEGGAAYCKLTATGNKLTAADHAVYVFVEGIEYFSGKVFRVERGFSHGNSPFAGGVCARPVAGLRTFTASASALTDELGDETTFQPFDR